LIKIVADTEAAIRWSQQPRFKLEIGLMQMIKMDSSIDIRSLLQQLEELKKKINGKAFNSSLRISDQLPEPSVETPIRGNVKASQPVLRPEQVVAVNTDSMLLYATSGSLSQPPMAVKETGVLQQSLPALSIDEAKGKWSTLVEEATKQRIALGTMLSETKLVSFAGDRLRIGCPDDFHLDALTRNREFLSQLAHKVYGSRIRFETILSNDKPDEMKRGNNASETPQSNYPEKKKDGKDQHPVIQALIREFGAKEVD
jgi:hypothetical protein